MAAAVTLLLPSTASIPARNAAISDWASPRSVAKGSLTLVGPSRDISAMTRATVQGLRSSFSVEMLKGGYSGRNECGIVARTGGRRNRGAIIGLLVCSFDSDVRKRVCRDMMRTSEPDY
jgi:hypothetical protein